MRYINFHLTLFGLLLLTAIAPVKAQQQVLSVYDSSVISSKNKPQQRDFLNNTYDFPAKPRSQWEVGASFGMLTIGSDVLAVAPTFGFAAHVRKSLSYIFSLRLQYLNGTSKGLNDQAPFANTKNPAWLDNSVPGFRGNLPNGKGYNAMYRDNQGNLVAISPTLNGGDVQKIYSNYKTHLQDLSLQGIFNFNNIRFNKQKTKLSFYVGGGLGFTAYHTMVNALDAGGNNYTALFNEISTTVTDKKEVRKQLKSRMDKSYETEAESERNRGKMGKNTVNPTATFLGGASYRLSKNISLALEARQTIIKTDLLDGQQWQSQASGDVVATRDYDSYNFVSLGLNFHLGAKSVEPLWWLNPLDYAYSEINNPKHMKLPKPIIDDADGDGVTDQLDKEPNTVAGAPVDTHGVAKDTDGDGVPDYKDKQLVTPTDCQPVDADGVGKCPEPACCKEIKAGIAEMQAKPVCPTDYPSVSLKSASLNNDSKALLQTIANKLKQYPTCTISITAYSKADKKSQANTANKVDLVKTYLIEKEGISADRISTDILIDGGDPNTIDFK